MTWQGPATAPHSTTELVVPKYDANDLRPMAPRECEDPNYRLFRPVAEGSGQSRPTSSRGPRAAGDQAEDWGLTRLSGWKRGGQF